MRNKITATRRKATKTNWVNFRTSDEITYMLRKLAVSMDITKTEAFEHSIRTLFGLRGLK